VDDKKSFTIRLQRILLAGTFSNKPEFVIRINKAILFKEIPLSNCTVLMMPRIARSSMLKFGANSSELDVLCFGLV
jgi:hypothetical protein